MHCIFANFLQECRTAMHTHLMKEVSMGKTSLFLDIRSMFDKLNSRKIELVT